MTIIFICLIFFLMPFKTENKWFISLKFKYLYAKKPSNKLSLFSKFYMYINSIFILQNGKYEKDTILSGNLS